MQLCTDDEVESLENLIVLCRLLKLLDERSELPFALHELVEGVAAPGTKPPP